MRQSKSRCTLVLLCGLWDGQMLWKCCICKNAAFSKLYTVHYCCLQCNQCLWDAQMLGKYCKNMQYFQNISHSIIMPMMGCKNDMKMLQRMEQFKTSVFTFHSERCRRLSRSFCALRRVLLLDMFNISRRKPNLHEEHCSLVRFITIIFQRNSMKSFLKNNCNEYQWESLPYCVFLSCTSFKISWRYLGKSYS